MGDETRPRAGRAGVYERPARAKPVWVWALAVVLALLAAAWWLA